MSGLPRGWSTHRVGDLGQLKLGKMLDRAKNAGSPAKYLRNINVRWFRFDLNDLNEIFISPEEMSQFSVEDGDLFICEGGEPGRCAIWTGRGDSLVYQKALHRFRSDGAILPKFLMYRLRHDADSGVLADRFSGTTIKHLTRESLVAHELPLAPLAEQKRITDKLDTLLARVDACREHLDRVPAILKRFRQSVLAAATSGELTREWRERRGVQEVSQTISFGDEYVTFPASWHQSPLAELLDPSRPLCYGVVQPGESSTSGPFLVRVQDLVAGTIALNDLRTISNTVDREYQRSRVRGGDVLISVVGTIGRIAIVPDGFEGNIARAVARLACGPRVLPQWTQYWLESNPVQCWLVRNAREVARKTLNLSEVAAVRVAVPPLPEQTEIARRTQELLSYAKRTESRLLSLRRIVDNATPSTLAKAFRGDLVPQDPTDEPAAALLARIAAQRDDAGASSAPRRGRKATASGPRA